MPPADPKPPSAPRSLRVATLQLVATMLGLTYRQARDYFALTPSVRQFRHPRSTIVLVSLDDIEALLGSPSQDGTTAVPVVAEPTTADDVLAAVGLRRTGGTR